MLIHVKVYEIGKADLRAFETFLGNKKYLFGEQPCVEDATLFSFTCMIIHLDKGPFNQFINSEDSICLSKI